MLHKASQQQAKVFQKLGTPTPSSCSSECLPGFPGTQRGRASSAPGCLCLSSLPSHSRGGALLFLQLPWGSRSHHLKEKRSTGLFKPSPRPLNPQRSSISRSTPHSIPAPRGRRALAACRACSLQKPNPLQGLPGREGGEGGGVGSVYALRGGEWERVCVGGVVGLQGDPEAALGSGTAQGWPSLCHICNKASPICHKPRLGSEQQDTVGTWSTGPRGLQASPAAQHQENQLTTQALLFLTCKTEIMPLKLQGHFDPRLKIKREAL